MNRVNSDLYAVDIYPVANFYEKFDPTKEYEKWATIEVSDFNTAPKDMEKLIIPKGLYAVFHYRGKPSEAHETFKFIYGVWLPNSAYVLDDRPYFALMGKKYKGEDPASEEEFWIPIKDQ